MTSRLIDCLSTTDALAAVFDDRSVIDAMRRFEVALARAAARAGAIPEGAVRHIDAAAAQATCDAAAIARAARLSATPAIPYVKALRDAVRAVDEESASFVHWGATSQDVIDTAMVLLLKRARPIVAADHERIDRALRTLSDRHAGTIMLGRTLLQPATIITFGLKVAGWLAAIDRAWRRLDAAWNEVLVLQLGGAAGTRAALGAEARAIVGELAGELGLAAAPPWHTDRDRLGAFVAALGLYAAALAKAAGDIALLMQAEVGEAAERGGGSSAMPQKRNPSSCTVVLAAATRAPHLVSAFLSGIPQEHERAAGGLQAEWPTVAGAVQTAGSAADAFAQAIEGLAVDEARMRANIDATLGLAFAEQAVVTIGRYIGMENARAAVERAVQQTRSTGRRLGDVIRDVPEIAAQVPDHEMAGIDQPVAGLGEAEALRQDLLAGSRPRT
jgi:3-carboxy-cis,cis-muconate cycloisomerase